MTLGAVVTIGVYHGHFPGICVKVRQRTANDVPDVDDTRDVGLANIAAFSGPSSPRYEFPEKWTEETLDSELRRLAEDLLQYGRPFLTRADADWKGLRRFLDERISKMRAEMPWLKTQRVLEVVQKAFRKGSWSRVLDLLDTYGVESYERERERVQLAILKLSEGNEEKLRNFVAVAKRDYRDVLFWADNPEEAKLTPEKRKRLKKMFEQFGIKPPENL